MPSGPPVFCTTWNVNTGLLEFSERLWRTEWGGRLLFCFCNTLLVWQQACGSESLHGRLLPARPASLHWCVQRLPTRRRRRQKVQGAAKVFLSLCLFSHWGFFSCLLSPPGCTTFVCEWVYASECLCAIYATTLFTAGEETKLWDLFTTGSVTSLQVQYFKSDSKNNNLNFSRGRRRVQYLAGVLGFWYWSESESALLALFCQTRNLTHYLVKSKNKIE